MRSLLLSDKKSEFGVEELTIKQFWGTINFLMNMITKSDGCGLHDKVEDITRAITYSDKGAKLAYKLADIQPSLICDYLYTKFRDLKGLFPRLAFLVLTSTALALFAVVHHKGKGRSANVKHYSVADVAISYALLLGAVMLEISSVLTWLMSSYWPYMGCIEGVGSPRIVLSILKHLRRGPEIN